MKDQLVVEVFDRDNWINEVAPQLNYELKGDRKKILFDNEEIGKVHLEIINIEEGLFIRYSDILLNQDIVFKEYGNNKGLKYYVFEFAFQGYPDGTVISDLPGKSLSEKKNIYLYSDNSSIMGKFPSNIQHTFMTIFVGDQWLKRNFQDFLNLHPYFNVSLESNRTFFKKMEYGVNFEKTLEQLMSRSYSDELRRPIYKGVVLMIVSEVLYRFTELDSGKYSFEKEIQQKLDDLEEYIKENLSNEITVGQLCKRIGFSKTKLHHLFKDYFKYSMYDYIKHLRMTKAKSLLMTTSLSIAEVANMVGYNSVTHFTNLFKKENGITPSKFKNGGYSDTFGGFVKSK
ncbi:AraC family transcriptional regulator [Flammeovirga pacifica]|nr:AraC family transcriptional regulator [Flammeovirga pacifica]